MYAAGVIEKPPGMLLKDLLAHTGGAYVGTAWLNPEMCERIRLVANISQDTDLLEIADHPLIKISLEQFRGYDPETTRVVCGWRFNVTPEESSQLGLNHTGPWDPRTTIHLDT
jgi:hypothetical protein